MKQAAFLIDISDHRGDDKYTFLAQVIALMVKGVLESENPHLVHQMVSTLTGDTLVEILEQFEAAFADIEGVEMSGMARISTRLFLNLRGLEISVWTSKDEMYTIFVATDPFQVATAVSKLSGFDGQSKEFKGLLNKLLDVVHSFIFPPYSDIVKTYKQ